jgi:KipI family sensor histidine kinase inhibitor
VTATAPAIDLLGDSALILRWEPRVDADLNARVHALAGRIAAARPRWLIDMVPAYASLALFLDRQAFDLGADPQREARRWLQPLLRDAPRSDAAAGITPAAPRTEITVQYGGVHGPDLADVAALTDSSEADVVARHIAGDYRVAMLGFAPGFPYLLGLDPRLHVPRLAQPRQRVAAGSVAIGGAQTGIYPRSGPGGWRVIGRTTLDLFDAARDPASLLQPGDRVRFVCADAVRR